MPARIEAQVRWDWELVPATYSLYFASEVNLSTSLAIKRLVQHGDGGPTQTLNAGKAAMKIYETLWSGKYKTASGSELPIRGDLTKMSSAIDLSPEERALFRNYSFISGKLSGTRQIRRSINHYSIASRIPPGRVEDQEEMKDVITNRFSMCTLELNDVVLVFDVVVM